MDLARGIPADDVQRWIALGGRLEERTRVDGVHVDRTFFTREGIKIRSWREAQKWLEQCEGRDADARPRGPGIAAGGMEPPDASQQPPHRVFDGAGAAREAAAPLRASAPSQGAPTELQPRLQSQPHAAGAQAGPPDAAAAAPHRRDSSLNAVAVLAAGARAAAAPPPHAPAGDVASRALAPAGATAHPPSAGEERDAPARAAAPRPARRYFAGNKALPLPGKGSDGSGGYDVSGASSDDAGLDASAGRGPGVPGGPEPVFMSDEGGVVFTTAAGRVLHHRPGCNCKPCAARRRALENGTAIAVPVPRGLAGERRALHGGGPHPHAHAHPAWQMTGNNIVPPGRRARLDACIDGGGGKARRTGASAFGAEGYLPPDGGGVVAAAARDALRGQPGAAAPPYVPPALALSALLGDATRQAPIFTAPGSGPLELWARVAGGACADWEVIRLSGPRTLRSLETACREALSDELPPAATASVTHMRWLDNDARGPGRGATKLRRDADVLSLRVQDRIELVLGPPRAAAQQTQPMALPAAQQAPA